MGRSGGRAGVEAVPLIDLSEVPLREVAAIASSSLAHALERFRLATDGDALSSSGFNSFLDEKDLRVEIPAD